MPGFYQPKLRTDSVQARPPTQWTYVRHNEMRGRREYNEIRIQPGKKKIKNVDNEKAQLKPIEAIQPGSCSCPMPDKGKTDTILIPLTKNVNKKKKIKEKKSPQNAVHV